MTIQTTLFSACEESGIIRQCRNTESEPDGFRRSNNGAITANVEMIAALGEYDIKAERTPDSLNCRN